MNEESSQIGFTLLPIMDFSGNIWVVSDKFKRVTFRCL